MAPKKKSPSRRGGRDKNRDAVPFEDRYATTVPDFIAHVGLGRTKTYELIKSKKLKTVHVDGRTLILVGSALKLLKQEATGAARP
jgi:hypothetical protein